MLPSRRERRERSSCCICSRGCAGQSITLPDLLGKRMNVAHPGHLEKEHRDLLALSQGLHGESLPPAGGMLCASPLSLVLFPNTQNIKCTFPIPGGPRLPITIPRTAHPLCQARCFPAFQKAPETSLMLFQSWLSAEVSGAVFLFGAVVCSVLVLGAWADQEMLNPCEMEPSCAEIKSGRFFESTQSGSGGGCGMELASGHACL